MTRRYTKTNGEVRTYAYSGFRANALAQCRAALRIGPLRDVGQHYLFGRRLFSCSTVLWLISHGEAVRDGDFVRMA
jgi:hypothetical protein